MTDPEDRLVDHALREVLGESSEAGPDLSRLVREAWERGERRPAPRLVRRSRREQAIDAALREPPPDRAPRPRLVREAHGWRPGRRVAAAAAVLVAGGAVALLSTRGGGPADGTGVGPAPSIQSPASPATAVLARADRALRVGSASDAVERELGVGRAAFVPRGASARVTLPDGAAVEAEPGALFAFVERDLLELGGGTFRVDAARAAARLELPGGVRLDLPAGAAMRVAFRTDREARRPVDPGHWLATALPTANGVVDVRVERGAVSVTIGGEAPERLAPDAEPTFYLIARGAGRRASNDDLVAHESIKELSYEALPPALRLEMLGMAYREGALAQLRRSPELWPFVADSVDRLLALDVSPAYFRSALLRALAVDPSPMAARRVRRAWLDDPEVFDTETIVAMAERGAFEFEREALAWLDEWEPGAEGDPLPIALWLALRGDDRGLAFLREVTLDVTPEQWKGENAGRPLIVAACLDRLGDDDAWETVVEPFVAATRGLLEDGDLENAAMRVDLLSYALALRDGERLDGVGDDPEAVPDARIGLAEHWVGVHHRARNADERSAEALADELDVLASI